MKENISRSERRGAEGNAIPTAVIPVPLSGIGGRSFFKITGKKGKNKWQSGKVAEAKTDGQTFSFCVLRIAFLGKEQVDIRADERCWDGGNWKFVIGSWGTSRQLIPCLNPKYDIGISIHYLNDIHSSCE